MLWYVELALLRLIDQQGTYSSRLGAKITGVVEDVPWKESGASSGHSVPDAG